MTTITELVLLESPSARSAQMEGMPDPRVEEVLNKAKALVFIARDSSAIALTGAIAEYFEVSEDTVTKSARRHRDEFLLDGLRVASRKDAEFATDKMSDASTLHQKTRRVLLWTPRAALRLGMLLRDSAVAKQIRSLLVNLAANSEPVDPERLEFITRTKALSEHLQWFKERDPVALAYALSVAGVNHPPSQALELLDTYGLLSNRMGLAFNKQLKAVELCNDITGVEEMQKLKSAYVQQVRENTDLEGKVKKLKADLKKAEVVIETWKNRAEGLEMVIKRDNSSLGIVEPTPPTGRKPAASRAIVTPPPSSDSSAYGSMLVPFNQPHHNTYEY